MVAMFGLVDDPKVTRYVSLVGLAVAQFASRQLPFRFGILDTDIVGAYALPGGYIFITRGSLSGLTNEAQLAGALGHEIVHVADRHLEREIRASKTSAWILQEADTSGKTGDLKALRADAFLKDLFNTRMSRDKEDSADIIGSELAAQAGYDSAGLLQFLSSMEQASQRPENTRMFGQLLSTHPPFGARIAALQPETQRLGSGATLEDRFRSTIFPQ
jgi:predicted Zn-dependent protease